MLTGLVSLLAAGVSDAEILRDYPDLEIEDIPASFQCFAAQSGHAVLSHA
ncbi:MAG: DUF433 domain-containing protein [Chthoniobacterales bacterium]